MTRKSLLLAGFASFGLCGAALAAGTLQGYPVSGGTQYCQTYGPSGTCTQYMPPGPGVTGVELAPADTGLANGANPQTVAMPLYGFSNPGGRNWARGGEFAENLWQRGTTFSAVSPTTYSMTADGWMIESANNVMTVTKQTPVATAADYISPTHASVMRVARPSGTPSGSSCTGQILDTKASAGLVGKNAVLRFFGYAPSTFSAANSAISVSIAYYTAADNSTPYTNTATFGLSMSGQASGIAGYQAAVAGFSGPVPAGASVASGVATIPLTATPTLYAVYAPIPVVNSSGTAVTGVGFSFCATPTSTATISTDYFELGGVQLQGMPSSTVSPEMPNGVTSYSPFDLQFPNDETRRELSYYWQINEPAASVAVSNGGTYYATTTCLVPFTFPVPMREAPTVAFGGTALANTTFAIIANSATPIALASTYLVQSALGANTTYQGALTATTAAKTAGFGCVLVGAGGGANIQWSAEP